LSSLLLGLLLGPSVTFAAGKCERLIATGSPDAPPFLWRDPQDPKHLIGANADLLKRAAADMGIKVELLYAGKRSQAVDEVRSGRRDLLVDAPLNVAELDSLDYVHPPISHNDIMLWKRRDQVQPFSSLTDLAGFQGAASERIRLTSPFSAAVKEQLRVERLPGLTVVFQKLMLGQVDYR